VFDGYTNKYKTASGFHILSPPLPPDRVGRIDPLITYYYRHIQTHDPSLAHSMVTAIPHRIKTHLTEHFLLHIYRHQAAGNTFPVLKIVSLATAKLKLLQQRPINITSPAATVSNRGAI